MRTAEISAGWSSHLRTLGWVKNRPTIEFVHGREKKVERSGGVRVLRGDAGDVVGEFDRCGVQLGQTSGEQRHGKLGIQFRQRGARG